MKVLLFFFCFTWTRILHYKGRNYSLPPSSGPAPRKAGNVCQRFWDKAQTQGPLHGAENIFKLFLNDSLWMREIDGTMPHVHQHLPCLRISRYTDLLIRVAEEKQGSLGKTVFSKACYVIAVCTNHFEGKSHPLGL